MDKKEHSISIAFLFPIKSWEIKTFLHDYKKKMTRFQHKKKYLKITETEFFSINDYTGNTSPLASFCKVSDHLMIMHTSSF